MGTTAQPDEGTEPYPDLFASPCGYFDGRTSHYTVFRLPAPEDAFDIAAPDNLNNTQGPDAETCQQIVFDSLLAEGFRRADDFVYRADCPDCRQCIPIRIAVPDFKPSKSQRRVLSHNEDITIRITQNPADFITTEKVKLYCAYDRRHNPHETKTSDAGRAELMQMNGVHECASAVEGVRVSYSGTFNMEYRMTSDGNTPGKLIGVGIVDAGADSLSSNYFYYDISPGIMKRSIGTYSILREIDLCRRLGFGWYYLGYWLADCRKMVYKSAYNPHQLFTGGSWQTAEK
ncbi:MAG: arginyltransferase [Treponema sp.]|nr:arginyltransferase [Treponema sp.]